MSIAKPMGAYAEQMLAPDGWPEVDEDTYHDRAQQYTEVLRRVTEVLETCQHEQSEIFDGGTWSGGAAAAANSELATNIDELSRLQSGLATVISWHRYVAGSITQAKSDISDNVEIAQTEIIALENDATLDADERTAAINTVVSDAYVANLGLITGTAEQILASKTWKPPNNALKDLLDQKMPPPVTLPDTTPPDREAPIEEERPRPSPAQPAPAPAMPPLSPPGMPTPGGGAGPTPGVPPLPGHPPVPSAPTPGGAGPTVPGGPGGAPGGPPGRSAPLSPAASAEPLVAGGRGKGMAPASLASPSVATRPEESSAAAPGAATGMPAGPMASGGSRAGGAAPSAGSATGQKPPSTSATTRPAAAGNRTAARPASHSAPAPDSSPTEHTRSSDAVAMAPIIPVSAARAERDAIAEAATADAERRRSGGSDPVRMARRIAAALNAPGMPGGRDLGFFWVTAVTTDGAIVVANSFGLAYIPDGVQLPEPVELASADDTIPVAERAQWATYPVMAVQGWAAHHDAKLRAVIATEEQLANSDAGVAKIVLKPDDIPESGEMEGRPRLEVVDPESAQRLAATTDVRLTSLLPPAPAGGMPSGADGKTSLKEMLAQAPTPPDDTGEPADRRHMLWFDVMKPLASRSPGRQAAHLRAFHTYAEHAQGVALAQAHTAVDPQGQRSAIADWMYWTHLTGLLNAALADAK
ncbi:hypothetical protein [Mycobacterium sp. SP-6446]|uniref:hypothetical protein n=1 Tax=Mycobacterium sp. SP-6446 TaxID=1834162 RepID=UPI00096DE20C|nr:hypothetical protein [Mycobacterium sp. SP-6446]OMC11913.1 hypothetical protein A5736_02150 [Mycobacterium sp. SP-6446]